MVMIKDNHISVAGGIANAMRSVDQFLQKEKLTIPVEVGTFLLTRMLKRTNLCVYILTFFVVRLCLD
jgi:nicotinate-nucleotide pyrophosphorylase